MTPCLTRRQVLARFAISAAVPAAALGFLGHRATHDRVLDQVSHLNDTLQAGIFSPDRLAQTYSKEQISTPFRYNGIVPPALVPRIDIEAWRLQLAGRVERTLPLDIEALRSMSQYSQITRLICIEGWSAIGHWAGPRLADVLRLAGADLEARYVSFRCADGYHTSIDMASALHPQTILALEFMRRPLAPEFGAPARLRIPTKLGFKNAKNILSIEVTNTFPGGYWEAKGYNWFAGL